MKDSSVVRYFLMVHMISFHAQLIGIVFSDWLYRERCENQDFPLASSVITTNCDSHIEYISSDVDGFCTASFYIHIFIWFAVIWPLCCGKIKWVVKCYIFVYALAGILSLTGCSIMASLASSSGYSYGIAYYIFLGSGIFITLQAILATYCMCLHRNRSVVSELPQQITAATNDTDVADPSYVTSPERTIAATTVVRSVVNRDNVAAAERGKVTTVATTEASGRLNSDNVPAVERKKCTTVATTAASGGLNRCYIAAAESRELTTVTTTGTSGRLNRGYEYQ